MRYSELERLDIRRITAPEEERFCVIDFETNGMVGAGCEVIEFAAVKVEHMELTYQVSEFCSASAPLSPFIKRLTGIKDGMILGKPKFETFVPLLIDFARDCVLVAHNAPFDVGILLGYCDRLGIEFMPRVICTLTSSRRLFPDFPSHRLEVLSELFAIKSGRSHRALDDTLATARLLILMFEYLKKKGRYG